NPGRAGLAVHPPCVLKSPVAAGSLPRQWQSPAIHACPVLLRLRLTWASWSRVTSPEEEAAAPGVQQEDAHEPGETSASSRTDSTHHSPESECADTRDASAGPAEPPHQKSFHPQIKWFQKEDVVVLKIRIQDVRDYRCKYSRDRVIFRASVGDKVYLADLELQANIVKDDCKCIIKNHEPVITLTKEKKEPWRGLLKHKNPNVAFDFDHWEDCDEDSPFAKVAHSRSPWGRVVEVAESSSASSDDARSESE
ncbi:putative ATP-dependent RNA helicase TDRD12, partial [Thomomys bottae]